MYGAILREIQAKGDQARFGKAARGRFALRRVSHPLLFHPGHTCPP